MKSRNLIATGLGLLAMALGAIDAQADVIVAQYTFAGDSISPTTTDLGVSGSTVTSGNPTAPLSSAFSGTSDNWFMRDSSGGSGDVSTFPDSEAAAGTANMFFTFTLTPSSAVNLTELTVSVGGTQSPGATYTGAAFLADASGNRIGDVTTYAVGSNTSATTYQGTLTVDLSALPAYQNVNSPVTFRVYGYIDSGRDVTSGAPNPSQQILRFDNITVMGNDLIPEPASLALLGVGAVLIIGAGGRRGKSARP
ncbi:MAG: PEP-CTERM sorting domain-containing protein [Phycisphaeraceae bacterium]